MHLPVSVTSSPLLELPGYTSGEVVYQGTRTVVYRAVQTAQQQPVVIKALRHDCPSFRELVQFRNQYVIAKNLAVPGVVRPLSLETLGNGYAMFL